MDNTLRTLAGSIAVDGWIGEFGDDGKASVYVDVVFREGVFGDDASALIRFKIKLKRAEVILRPVDGSPIKVEKQSVARTYSKVSGKKTSKKQKTAKRSLFGGLALDSSKGISAKAGANAEKGISEQEDLELSEEITSFLCQHFIESDGVYGWELGAGDGAENYLEGAPWDVTEEPRLRVRRDGNSDIDEQPAMLVEIRCRREDIEIIDLEEKDPQGRQVGSAKKQRQANLVAAEQIIKEELQKAGFFAAQDMSENTSKLVIADKIILEDK